MSFVRIVGARIHYEIFGAGEPLVLLHGNSENIRYFQYQIPAFSNKYKVIAIDTRAHGDSTRGGGLLDFPRFADDVCAVLDAAGTQSAHILGFSDGGNTALTLALRHPERVRSLILNGANLFPSGNHPLFGAVVALAWAAGTPFAPFSTEIRRQRELLHLMLAHPHISPETLSAVRVPALVIAGEHDIILREHTVLIARALPHAKLRILPHTGHACAADRPGLFNRLVLDFLQSVN